MVSFRIYPPCIAMDRSHAMAMQGTTFMRGGALFQKYAMSRTGSLQSAAPERIINIISLFQLLPVQKGGLCIWRRQSSKTHFHTPCPMKCTALPQFSRLPPRCEFPESCTAFQERKTVFGMAAAADAFCASPV